MPELVLKTFQVGGREVGFVMRAALLEDNDVVAHVTVLVVTDEDSLRVVYSVLRTVTLNGSGTQPGSVLATPAAWRQLFKHNLEILTTSNAHAATSCR